MEVKPFEKQLRMPQFKILPGNLKQIANLFNTNYSSPANGVRN